MSITRTIVIDDLTPNELAIRFCDMNAEQQASFFSWVGEIAASWPGAGMCQQACAIAEHIGPNARYVIERLADHAGLLGAISE